MFALSVVLALERAEITQLSNGKYKFVKFDYALERAEITQLSNTPDSTHDSEPALERAEITQLSNAERRLKWQD